MIAKKDIVLKIHLIVSVIIVIPIAFIYGYNPDLVLNIKLQTIDEHNFFKSIMGLYIGFSILWLFGIFKNKFLKTALISNVVFMFSLGCGRVLSIITDGTPSLLYTLGILGELSLALYGFLVLQSKYFKNP